MEEWILLWAMDNEQSTRWDRWELGTVLEEEEFGPTLGFPWMVSACQLFSCWMGAEGHPAPQPGPHPLPPMLEAIRLAHLKEPE